MPVLQFGPFHSAIDATFWVSLTKAKINVWKLSQEPVSIKAGFNSPLFCLSSSAFDDTPFDHKLIPYNGYLLNLNTIEEFKLELSRLSNGSQVLVNTTSEIWHAIKSGQALDNPHLISKFILISFSNLKTYKYNYWCAWPALCFEKPATFSSINNIAHEFNPLQIESLDAAYKAYKLADPINAGFFLVNEKDGQLSLHQLNEYKNLSGLVYLGFLDPSKMSTNPGWPLRNLLILARHSWNISLITVLCLRETIAESIIVSVNLPNQSLSDEPASVSGLEKNADGKFGSRSIDLAPMMDPKLLARTAVDLNLKLMRWRILPELDLERISSTKCLLLGAGTLGCYVARSLMAWGINHITFVDNGTVSLSNPVRQPLYNFSDCGLKKAEAAAAALRNIYPPMESQGFDFTIPMPGHPIPSSQENATNENVKLLEDLIISHDAIFLLTDSRESRWLPTLLGTIHQKIVINTALGFDTFLVMRHGIRPESSLGCYFCNDVVAPIDSLSYRTLDQQCTVTRPGLSAIASGVAVELLISILSHPKGYAIASFIFICRAFADGPAPALPTDALPEDASLLGLVPHQIRGFLTQFSNLLLSGRNFDRCTACSFAVTSAYQKDGFQFLMEVFADAKQVLEKLTGIHGMMEQADEVDIEWLSEEEL